MPATNGKSNRSKFFAYLMFGDIFLVGLQPILIQASKVGGKYAYNPLTLNLLIEATKTTVMLSLLLIRGIGKNKYGSPSLQSVKQMLRQNYLLIVPACLYALNNYVKFIMQGHDALHAKAGKAVPIPKGKGDPLSVGARRAIILRSLVVKVHHKFVRSLAHSSPNALARPT